MQAMIRPPVKKPEFTIHPRRNLLTRYALIKAIVDTEKTDVLEIVNELAERFQWNPQERRLYRQRIGDICAGMAEQAKLIKEHWPVQRSLDAMELFSENFDRVTNKALHMRVPDFEDN